MNNQKETFASLKEKYSIKPLSAYKVVCLDIIEKCEEMVRDAISQVFNNLPYMENPTRTEIADKLKKELGL